MKWSDRLDDKNLTKEEPDHKIDTEKILKQEQI